MINFIDSVMGTGKSTFAINHINSSKEEEKYMVASLILTETARYAQACQLWTPEDANIPKSQQLLTQLQQGQSVSITHALLLRMQQEHFKAIQEQSYTLILDEVIADAIQALPTTSETIASLEKLGFIEVDSQTKQVHWIAENPSAGADFKAIKDATQTGSVFVVKEQGLVSLPNLDIFRSFKQVYILTYMAEFSLLAQLFKAVGIDYEVLTLDGQGGLQPFCGDYSGTQFKDLIHLDSSNLRKLTCKLSRAGFKRRTLKEYEEIQRKTNAFFVSHKAKKREVMWTTFMAHRDKLLPTKVSNPKYGHLVPKKRDSDGFTDFVQHSSKGVNHYSDAKCLAYLLDKFMHPMVVHYLHERRVGISSTKQDQTLSIQDWWALSELLQWIWRSRIRKHKGSKNISIYLPSERMRRLLTHWLNKDNKHV